MKKLNWLVFLFTILLLNACYKDSVIFDPYEIDNPDPTPSGDIGEFFEALPDNAISVTLVANETNYILTDQNTLFEIGSGYFVDQEGNPVGGEIEFKYLEILHYPLYTFYQLPTVSDGKLLRTEGVFRFEAYQDNKPLKLAEGKRIKVRLPDDDPEFGMKLFYGEGEGEDFNWTLEDGNIGTDNGIRVNEWGIQIDSLQTWFSGYGYEFDCDLFKWINVDIFFEVPEDERTSVCVELPENYTDKNTIVFMLFKDIKSIVLLHGNEELQMFCEPYGATPIGYEVSFIVIANLGDDEFHFALQDAKITDNHIESIFPVEKSLDEIISIIENL